MSMLLLAADSGPGWFYELYAQGMRNSLFTGFLTLCGFLMSAKTFIVVNMKKEVYDNDTYKKNFRVQQALDPTLSLYRPLLKLANSLTWNVALALATAVSQFTIGLIKSPFAAIFCLLIATVTVGFLAVSLYRIRWNLSEMFRWQEIDAKEKTAAKQEQATAPTVSPPRA